MKEFASAQTRDSLAFYFNRSPSAALSIPITLYSPIFDQFEADCEGYEPTDKDHAFALELSRAMSRFYDDEGKRLDNCREVLRSHQLDFNAET